mgnify:CR=1 FL=1
MCFCYNVLQKLKYINSISNKRTKSVVGRGYYPRRYLVYHHRNNYSLKHIGTQFIPPRTICKICMVKFAHGGSTPPKLAGNPRHGRGYFNFKCKPATPVFLRLRRGRFPRPTSNIPLAGNLRNRNFSIPALHVLFRLSDGRNNYGFHALHVLFRLL